MANTPKKLIQNAKDMIDKKYVYVYGYKGSTVTKSQVMALARMYPSVFTSSILSMALRKVGKIGIDCSGFVCKAAGISSRGSLQIYSEAKANGKAWSINDLSHVKNGMFIWKYGHVALIEVTSSGKKYILEAQSTATDLKRTPFESRYRAFTSYGEIPTVSYQESVVKKKATSSTTKHSIVNTKSSTLNCREKGSLTAKVLGKFAKGTKLTVLKSGATWDKVQGVSTKGIKLTGYVSRKYTKEV